MERYCCEKDGWDFTANSASELLGVVGIFEYHNPVEYEEYWWRITDEWLIEDIPEKPVPYESVIKRS